MKQRKIFPASLIAAGLFAGAANASIIYSIDRTIGVGSVKGTITTDGTLGYLTNGVCDEDGGCQSGNTPGNNITDWSLTLSDGAGTFTIDSSNSGFWSYGGPGSGEDVLVGTNFIATESNLIYDFDIFGYALFQVYEEGSDGPSWLLSSYHYGNFEEVWGSHREERWERDSPTVLRSGQVVVGWSTTWDVPGPSSLAILAIGLAGVAGSRKLKGF